MNKKEFHKKYIRTKEFEEVRQAVFKRDGYRCVICHRTENLVCHHCNYKFLGQHNQNEIDNCVTLCQKDHLNHHSGKYNLHWYNPDHPRNCDDLREVDGVLVRSNGEDFFDAVTFKRLKVYVIKNRGDRNILRVNDKTILVYRLVAKAFPEICGEWFDDCHVHHLNEDPTDNRAENLKVMSAEEHKKLDHPQKRQKLSELNKGKHLSEETKNKLMKPIIQYSLLGEFIKEWNSVTEAAEHLCKPLTNISSCLTGKMKSAYGFVWKYKK